MVSVDTSSIAKSIRDAKLSQNTRGSTLDSGLDQYPRDGTQREKKEYERKLSAQQENSVVLTVPEQKVFEIEHTKLLTPFSYCFGDFQIDTGNTVMGTFNYAVQGGNDPSKLYAKMVRFLERPRVKSPFTVLADEQTAYIGFDHLDSKFILTTQKSNDGSDISLILGDEGAQPTYVTSLAQLQREMEEFTKLGQRLLDHVSPRKPNTRKPYQPNVQLRYSLGAEKPKYSPDFDENGFEI